MRDNHNNTEYRRVISPLTQTNADTAIVGQIIDHSGFDSVEYAVAYGNMTDANATVTALLEEGNDSALSDAAAVDDADLLGTEALAGALAASDDNTVKKLGYKGAKRYTRLTLTPSGNDSGALPVSATVALSGAMKQPTV
jgi:hypothetical protein